MIAEAIRDYADARAYALHRVRAYRDDLPRGLPPTDWRAWHAAYFADSLWPPYAPYHEAYWRWLWDIAPDTATSPFVAIWPRGFAKSTSVEVGAAAVAARCTRRYGLYICDVQDQADDHVQNVANMTT